MQPTTTKPGFAYFPMDKVINASLLVIDGLGDEEGARGGIATTRHILAKRYDSALPTLITTELAISNIGQMYGKGAAAMLAEEFACGGKLVDCGNAVTADTAYSQEEKTI